MICGVIIVLSVLASGVRSMQLESPAPLGAASEPTKPAPSFHSPAPAHLPAHWHATWRGPVIAQPVGDRPPTQFTMQLRVAPTDKPDRLTWEITYEGSAGKQVRPYELVAIDAAAGRYAIDEKNGIVIDAGLAGSTLSSHFEVQNVMITASYRLEPGRDQPRWNSPMPAGGRNELTPPPDRIVVEMNTFVLDQPRTSGGEGGAPPVKSWRLAAVQRAELQQVK